MLEELKDLPAGVIGFEAVGTVDSDDYEGVLRPAVEAAAEQGEIRLVYVFGDRFEGYSSGAAWEDTKLGLGNVRSWERTAIVSDHDWAEHLVKALGWLMPGKVRHFDVGALPEAIAWAREATTT
jgi:SpoIIAA-like